MIATFWLAASLAASPPVLGLDDVLDNALNTSMGQTLLGFSIEAADGVALSAQGDFDPKVKAAGEVESLGQTRSSLLSGAVVQRLGFLWGAAVSAGYRNGTAEAVYDGKGATSAYGEAYAKLAVPLLRDGYTDAVRTKAEVSGLKADATRLDATFGALSLAQAAADKYFSWKEKRFVALVQGWLLELAETRESVIGREVEAGKRAEFDLWDNQRLVAERRAELERQRAEVDVANYALQATIGAAGESANALIGSVPRSLEVHTRFFGPRGQRADAGPAATTRGMWHRICEAGAPTDEALGANLDRHPYVRKLAVDIESAKTQLNLANNQLLPRVDVNGFVSQDFGPTRTYGGQFSTKNLTEAGVGLSIEVPTLNRKARGTRRVALANLRQATTFQQRARLKLEADARALSTRLVRACAAAGAQALASDLALKVEAGAAKRYALGGLDLLALNLREQQAAGSLTKLGKAIIDVERAYVALWWLLGPDPKSRDGHLLAQL